MQRKSNIKIFFLRYNLEKLETDQVIFIFVNVN